MICFETPKSPFDTVFLYITYSKSPFDTVFLYITYSKSPFDTVLWSLPPPRGLCACLRRFGDLRKNTPWIFGACILWIRSISGELGGHQGWGNPGPGAGGASRHLLGEPLGRTT